MERMRLPEPIPERQRPRVERAVELERARVVIARVIAAPVPGGDLGEPPTGDGRVRQLERILEEQPQRDGHGNLQYLLTSGLAVELTTGYQRSHHDLDLVIMDPKNKGRYWEVYGTDNVTPGQYWADMQFNPEFLDQTAREVRTRRARRSPVVEVVHPGVIMVQKSSNAWGRPPRERDVDDVAAIVGHWKRREGYTREWNPVVRTSIDALPERQQKRTLSRLREAVAAQ